MSKSNRLANEFSNLIVYQIYPRSFFDTTGNGIGDLRGIIDKLDYLNDGTKESLGINVIWLSPIYASPMKDFGYDVSDYYDIDSVFGDLATFDELLAKAHRRGIKLILDFIPNHTSSRHPWFIESSSSLNNPKRDWYVWQSPKPDGSPPNNWLSRFGGSAWTLDKKTKQYYLHTFLPSQPDLNWRNKEVQQAMLKVMKFWLDRGVDGFRIDAFYHIFEAKSFKDNPPNPDYISGRDDPYHAFLHVYDRGRPETLKLLNTFCRLIEKYKNKLLVSELFFESDIKELKKFYKNCGQNIHIPLNFNFLRLPWQAEAYRKFIDNFEKILTKEYLPNYVLGNHDRSRVMTRLGEKKALLAIMLQLTLRGIPFIYYGEEIGMKDAKIPANKRLDPFGKRVLGLNLGRDPQRTPMQWNAEKYAGFSKSKPWLPVASNYKKINVAQETKDPSSVLNFYRRLIHFRKNSEAILIGDYYSLDIKEKEVFAYMRTKSKERILCLLNFSSKNKILSLKNFSRAEIICSTYMDKKKNLKIDLKNFLLKPYEGYLLKLKK